MEPIETEYKGYQFRSRAEARWAVFFDSCGIPFEYETQGYRLDGGRYWYLPDFYLPSERRFFEVKGGWPTKEELAKMACLARESEREVVFSTDSRFWGDTVQNIAELDQISQMFWFAPGDDEGANPWFPALFLRCDSCDGVHLHTEQHSRRSGPLSRGQIRIVQPKTSMPTSSFMAARSARFEHGHSGAYHNGNGNGHSSRRIPSAQLRLGRGDLLN